MPREQPVREALKSSLVNSVDGQASSNGPSGGTTVGIVDSSWAERLLMLHRRVRDAVMETGRVGSGARNAKGDDVKRFDLVADDAALGMLREFQLPLLVDSE